MESGDQGVDVDGGQDAADDTDFTLNGAGSLGTKLFECLSINPGSLLGKSDASRRTNRLLKAIEAYPTGVRRCLTLCWRTDRSQSFGEKTLTPVHTIGKLKDDAGRIKIAASFRNRSGYRLPTVEPLKLNFTSGSILLILGKCLKKR
jgi:hypothetical protein